MAASRTWKIAGSAAVVAGFGLGGLLGANVAGPDEAGARSILLQDAKSAVATAEPTPVTAYDDSQGSPDGESVDSPLQSNDSAADGVSVDTPGKAAGDSLDSAEAVRVWKQAAAERAWNDAAVDRWNQAAAERAWNQAAAERAAQSADSPDRGPAPAPHTASVDSPERSGGGVSFDSGGSADSAD
jgi:hypothetical protein